MQSPFNTFLLVLAAIFPVVNPPGSALVFLGLTRGVSPEIRRILAWRVARNSFFVLVYSLLLGALILEFFGISIPVLRVAAASSSPSLDGSFSVRAVKRKRKPRQIAFHEPIHSIRPSIR